MEIETRCSKLDGEEIGQMSVDSVEKFGDRRCFLEPVIGMQLYQMVRALSLSPC